MSFVDSFEYSYFLKSQRIYGDELRVLRGHPGPWQLQAVVGRAGQTEVVATWCAGQQAAWRGWGWGLGAGWGRLQELAV